MSICAEIAFICEAHKKGRPPKGNVKGLAFCLVCPPKRRRTVIITCDGELIWTCTAQGSIFIISDGRPVFNRFFYRLKVSTKNLSPARTKRRGIG